ncbi:MAG: thiamine phosphate synthase [Acetatifactor sp.]
MFRDTIAITNRNLIKGDYLEQIRKVVSLHPYALILREKDLTDEAYEELAGKVLQICEAGNVPCFLHSRYLVARKLGCRNIHLSLSDLRACKDSVREFEQISVSCHSLEDVEYAIQHGATQIILGTIFETECKRGLKGRGLSFVREVASYCRLHGDIPVFAIGGITPDNIEYVKEAGARGGCMMSYLMRMR